MIEIHHLTVITMLFVTYFVVLQFPVFLVGLTVLTDCSAFVILKVVVAVPL